MEMKTTTSKASGSGGTSGGEGTKNGSQGMYEPAKTRLAKIGPVRTIVSPPPVDNPDRSETKINVRNLLATATSRHQPGHHGANHGAHHSTTTNLFTIQVPKGGGALARPPSVVSELVPDMTVPNADRSRNNSLSPSMGMPPGINSRNGSVASAYGSFNLQVPTSQINGGDISPGGHSLHSNGDLRGLESANASNGNTGPGSAGNKSQPVGEQTPSEGKWKTMSGKVASSVCSIPVKKLFFGVIIMSLVTLSWVGATHLLKSTYTDLHREILFNLTNHTWEASTNFTKLNHLHYAFDAPLFTTWFCSMGTIFFLPFYLCCQMCCRGNPVVRQPSNGNLARDANLSGANSKHRANGLAISGPGNGNVNIHTSSVAQGAKKVGVTIILKESVRSLREKGFTFGKFVGRCCLFSLLWMLTNYFYICSLRILGCTEVMALFATNVCFIYLLSWVILHEQFVGIRIVAVILGNTGIALLAYMDGINQSPTLGAVALAAAASAGLAIYKVLFKRVMGEVSFCQVAIFFSMIGLCTTLLFWPLVLTLAFTGLEKLNWDNLPWMPLIGSLLLSLVSNLLANFGIVVTYETFITLGLVLAVPICAALDTHWYGAQFAGMKLAGIIVICLGFVIVLFPSNWPNCIHSLIRLGRRGQKKKEMGRKPPPDLRTGHLGSRLRSPSGRVK